MSTASQMKKKIKIETDTFKGRKGNGKKNVLSGEFEKKTKVLKKKQMIQKSGGHNAAFQFSLDKNFNYNDTKNQDIELGIDQAIEDRQVECKTFNPAIGDRQVERETFYQRSNPSSEAPWGISDYSTKTSNSTLHIGETNDSSTKGDSNDKKTIKSKPQSRKRKFVEEEEETEKETRSRNVGDKTDRSDNLLQEDNEIYTNSEENSRLDVKENTSVKNDDDIVNTDKKLPETTNKRRKKITKTTMYDFPHTTWMDIIRNPHIDINVKKKAINCINEKIAFLSILHNNNRLYLEKRNHKFEDPKNKTWKSMVDSIYDFMVRQNKNKHKSTLLKNNLQQ